MSVDLRIFPQYQPCESFSHDVISLETEEELFSLIEQAERQNGQAVGREGIRFLSHSKMRETTYGEVIQGVQAYQLKQVVSNYQSSHWKNKAFLAFLKELPDELELWIYWH